MKVKPACLASLCLVLVAGCGDDSDSSNNSGNPVNRTDLASKKITGSGSDGLWLLVGTVDQETKGSFENDVEWVDNLQADIKSYVRVKRNSDAQITIDRCDEGKVQLTLQNGKYTSDHEGYYEIVFIDNNEMKGTLTKSSLFYGEETNVKSTFKMVRINEDFNGFIGTTDYKINVNGNLDEGGSEVFCYAEAYYQLDYQYNPEKRKSYTAKDIIVELTNKYYVYAYEDSNSLDNSIEIYRPNYRPIYNYMMDSVKLLVEEESAVIDIKLTDSLGVINATFDINRM